MGDNRAFLALMSQQLELDRQRHRRNMDRHRDTMEQLKHRLRPRTITTMVGGQLMAVEQNEPEWMSVSNVTCGGNLVVVGKGGVTVSNVSVAGDIRVVSGSAQAPLVCRPAAQEPSPPAVIAKEIAELDEQAIALVSDAGTRARAVVARHKSTALWSRPHAAYVMVLFILMGLCVVAPLLLKVSMFLIAAAAGAVWWWGARRARADNATATLAELDKIDDEARAALKALEEA